MKYLAHTRSAVIYLMDEDLDFEIISAEGEYPATIEFGSEADAETAVQLGLVTKN